MFRKGIALVVMLLFIGTNFVTSTVSLNEKVTMATMKHSATVLLDENFSGPFPPDGWSTDWWTQCNCSGNPCACLYYYNQGDDNNSYITSKAVDASNYEEVILEFWFSGDVQTSCYLYVKYRKNETNPWVDMTPWDVPLSNDFQDWFQVAINLGPGGCGDALQINWTYFGHYSSFRYFYLDDVKILDNNPPDAPDIDGPTVKPVSRPLPKQGEPYNYTFKSTDHDGDNVSYYIEWGDGDFEDWFGPFESGEEVTRNHTWNDEGTYDIRAKAKDIWGAESDWGTLDVIMPKNQNMWFHRWLGRFPILQKILDVLRLNIG